MAQNFSVSLDDHCVRFLAEEAASGRYRTSSDVVHAGLQLLEEHENQKRALRSSLMVGDANGTPETLDIDAFIADKR
ncbi:type II toxin-antitoxin system ParD family antitoxin [Brachybacterium subflavum]|uniref:type II toxin-antitoxin system ParD family antitoxin n=1 Tax=Brachybacterium subflavum TaxID=2585206 RepID=UPI0012664B3E|nr:type II toxin-antitoxin system ParD family antitoxin [Brachybacterium subflavum]